MYGLSGAHVEDGVTRCSVGCSVMSATDVECGATGWRGSDLRATQYGCRLRRYGLSGTDVEHGATRKAARNHYARAVLLLCALMLDRPVPFRTGASRSTRERGTEREERGRGRGGEE
eukprot:1897806-Rhodomonas_salina.1